jgi:hypothetical protein
LTIIASAKLYGLGADESAPVQCRRSAVHLGISPTLLPWLTLLGLCLLKPNRDIRAWLVWLPILAMWGLIQLLQKWLATGNDPFRLFMALFPTALAFGWAAALLLPLFRAWPRRLPRSGLPLLGFGFFSLLSLAVSPEWKREIFLDIICPVTLPFMVVGIAAPLSLARRFASDGFKPLRLLGWFVLWCLVICLLILTPLATLSLLGDQQALGPVVVVAGVCCFISLLVSLPFLAMAAVSPWYQRRLDALI